MKKKLVLLITLIVCLFIYSGRVEAAKELTCIYDNLSSYDQSIFHMKMLIQTSDGRVAYVGGPLADSKYLNDYTWAIYTKDLDFSEGSALPELSFEEVNDDSLFDKESGTFLHCPKWWIVGGHQSQDWRPSYQSGSAQTAPPIYDKVYFGDKENEHCTEKICLGQPLLNSYNELPKIFKFYSGVNEDFGSIIDEKKDDWIRFCRYSDFEFYYSNDTIVFNYFSADKSIKSVSFKCTPEDLLEYGNACPHKVYGIRNTFNDYDRVSNIAPNTGEFYLYNKAFSHSFDILEDSPYKKVDDKDPVVINTCEDLFGEELINKINDYFNIIKIAVPILLIGFGIFDFSKAVFSGEEDMKKAKKTFVLRIVAAILFFLSPIIVKFVLTIANKVWNFIVPNSCIK